MLKKLLSVPSFVLKVATCLAASGLAVASVCGYLGKYSQLFELASHFRLLYAFGFLACSMSFMFLRLWKPLAVTLLVFVITDAIPLLQMYSPARQVQAALASPNTVTVFHANLWGGKNKNYAATLNLLKERNPDVICLSEVTPSWSAQLKASLSAYPYQIVEDRFGGVALFSKYPIASSKVEYFDAGTRVRPRILAKIKVNDSELTCLLVHPLVPLGKWFKKRNGEFEVIANELNSVSGNKILVGDLNCSPWSSYFQRLLNKTQMFDSERGYGPQASWPTFTKVPFIPIDHCLVGPSVQALSRQVGPHIGSDHFALSSYSLVGLVNKEHCS